MWEDNRDALLLFLALATQWTHAGMAGLRVGLRYEAVEPAARMMGIAMTAALFGDLRLMEGAALGVFAEAAEAAARPGQRPGESR